MWRVWEASFLHCTTSKVTALLRALQAGREFTPVLLFGVECFVSGTLHACVCPDRVACPIVACRRIPVTREPAPPQLLSASCPSNSLLQYPCHPHPLRTYRTHNTQETLQNVLEGKNSWSNCGQCTIYLARTMSSACQPFMRAAISMQCTQENMP